VTAGGGLAFWLSYVESRGGLWERSGETALVMVPPQLQHRLDLPEELAVTDHPDVAREDGVALLGAGHPLLLAAAEDVLSADDAGVLRLAAPAAVPPGDARLLERARETFPVDHGRIDACGPAERSLRQVLRVGAMVAYTASADDRFHERAECWVDVPSRHELPEQAVERMRRLATDGLPVDAAPDLGAVPPALAAAHRLLDQAAADRCRVLADGSVRAAADAERARAEKYYAEALASLARRQASAAPDRRTLLAARADGIRAEEKRRLAEIDEKYTPRHEIRPYRLHLLYLPALRIPLHVLRGARRFPLVLEWLLPAAAFAPLRCPSCGANARTWPLVAAKTHLGCARCLSSGAVSPPSVPRASSVPAPAFAVPARANGQRNGPALGSAAGEAGAAAGEAGAAASSGRGRAKAAGGTVPAKRRPSGSRPAPAGSRRVSPAAGSQPPSPQAVSKTGGKLAVEFWSVTGQGNLRALRRLCAPDSPAAAAIRLYGIQGPTTAIGVAAGDRPESLTSITSAPHAGELADTCGFLDVGRDRYNYLLRWEPYTRLVAEVLPFGSWMSARLPAARWLPAPVAARLFGGLPEPDCDLDPVAVRLWRKVLPAHGLPLALRCLAAWWRISDIPELPAGPRPSVLAAAIHRMIGYRAGEAGVTHDAIAGLHRVTAEDTRAITPALQARLQLSVQQPW
jgi:hypothetical protein